MLTDKKNTKIAENLIHKLKFKKKVYGRLINFFFNFSYFFRLKVLVKYYFKQHIIKGKSSKVILYLSPQRSTYEVDILLKNKISVFLLSKLATNEIVIFCRKEKNRVNFFKEIFEEINLGLIISPAYHYGYDNLFAKIFKSKKIKYLIFHRECYNFSENHTSSLKKLISSINHKADKILVHNKIYQNIFKRNLKNKSTNVDVLGPLRMQELIKLRNQKKPKKNINNKILFLSFTPGYAGGAPLNLGSKGHYGRLSGKNTKNNEKNIKNIDKIKFYKQSDKSYNYKQFYFAHKLFFDLVKKNPRFKFEIRLKFNNIFNKQIITSLCKKICGHIPSNLKFNKGNLWKSVEKSYFVCGYGSTGLLESSILDKPIIQIINEDLLDKAKLKKNLRISNHLDSFYVVKDKKKLNKAFNDLVILNKKPKEFEILNKRAKLAFINFIFDYRKNNNNIFLKIIFDLIN